MSLTEQDLKALDNHWAVDAIDLRNVDCAQQIANERFARLAVGKQISFSFAVNREHDTLLDRVAMAFELAAIEGLEELSRPSVANSGLRRQAIAASFRLFEFRRLLPIPPETLSRLFFVLQLSAAAVCGERGPDLRRWYRENQSALKAPSVAETTWDRRLLYRLFHCWVRLFRKNGWDDLDRIREIVAGLREDQKCFEKSRLNNGSPAKDQAVALRLAALYHWAKVTEILARYMLQGEPPRPFCLLEKHFDGAVSAATASGDAQHELMLRWLHAASRIMVGNSL